MDKEALSLLQKLIIGQEENNKKLNNLESTIKEIKDEQQKTNNSLNSIEIKLDNALGDLGKIISYDIGDSISTIKNDITEIKDKVCKLENVTKNNCYELANLKIVK